LKSSATRYLTKIEKEEEIKKKLYLTRVTLYIFSTPYFSNFYLKIRSGKENNKGWKKMKF